MTIFPDKASFLAALHNMPQADKGARALARERQVQLTKPAGSLGRLEDIALFMAGWQRQAIPALDAVQAVVFAGNHGVAAQGVSAFPPEVTAQMVENFRHGGAAINALSRACGASLSVVPLDLDKPTGDITVRPAMSEEECLAALQAGAASVLSANLLLVGEMGIGNTTPAAALCAQAFGGAGQDWVGRGTGLDDAGVARKIAAVDAALALHGADCVDPFETLRRLGGREIAAMAGAIVAARWRRIPVLLDGFICCAAIAPLVAVVPSLTDHCLSAHCSAEAAHGRLLSAMGLEPLLHLGLRLGEGSGAALAVQIVRSALATHAEMATFAQAQVADPL
jgi:nicotinate-nucleotide--dimethylbenzimidazole phosphoribosyltransferase